MTTLEGKKFFLLPGRGGGQDVSVLVYSSDEPSSNHTVAFLSVKIVLWKNENRQKKAGVSPF